MNFFDPRALWDRAILVHSGRRDPKFGVCVCVCFQGHFPRTTNLLRLSFWRWP